MRSSCVFIMFLSCLLLSTICGYGQTDHDVQFTHLTTLDGLSQSTVNCIVKDRLGFIWFGTQNGLNKYDGYEFKIYQNNLKKPGSIPNNNVKCMLVDKAGNLWVGTLGGGLAFYNRQKDAFEYVGRKGSESKIISNMAINCLYEDRRGNLWVGTFDGLNLLDRKTGIVKKYFHIEGQANTLSNSVINTIYEDKKGTLWIGTANGLNTLDVKTGTIKNYMHSTADAYSISNNGISSIIEDSRGTLWIGTSKGLNYLDPLSKHFYAYKHNYYDNNSISDDAINTMCCAGNGWLWVATERALELFNVDERVFKHYQELPGDERSLSYSSVFSLLYDDQGILWAGTYAGGVNKYDVNQTIFKLYRNFSDPNLNAGSVTGFAQQTNNRIWIGTDGGGLYLWERNTNKFTSFYSAAKRDNFNTLSIITMALSKKKDALYIGTYDKGLGKLDLKTMRFYQYPTDMLVNNSVYTLLEDSKGNIWIGTNGGGVSVLNPKTGNIKSYIHNTSGTGLTNNYIRSLFEDKDGNIWIGTHSGGINILNPQSGKLTYYNNTNSKLESNIIYAIVQDSLKNIWVGTMGGGLYLFNNKTRLFKPITVENGLSSNIVNSIIQGRSGKLWVSTDKGIDRIDSKTNKISSYTVLNGLQSNEFLLGSGYILSSGEMLFGGVNGFNLIDEKRTTFNKYVPKVVITDLLLFNKSVPINKKNSPLAVNINETREIVLQHNQSVFTIEFAALNYTLPQKNKYAYRLVGFDKHWTYTGNDRKATYTNLNPGEYTFEVIASNNDGVWNKKGTFIKIIIKPPFWRTNLAYLIYITLIGGIFFAIYKEIIAREKLKSEVHYQKVTAAKTLELNQLKMNFFTNISHELRTPLSLIIDPVRKIMIEDLSNDQVKKYSSLVFKNATRLMDLVNQLLNFRKLESGHIELEPKRTNVSQVVKDIFGTFLVSANERNIDYGLNINSQDLYAWIDVDKFQKILTNLIANAFKFTPDNGCISVAVSEQPVQNDGKQERYFEIHVKDNGPGIPAELLDKIFELFFQVKEVRRAAGQSSGIGLALTKQLVELHKGEIFVESASGKGADFGFRIPIGNENFNLKDTTPDYLPVFEEHEIDYANKVTEQGTSKKHKLAAPIILVVEDREDLRQYIHDELSGCYQVETAYDGPTGFDKAIDLIPDLVISDIMMPVYDGLELCRKLKLNEKTSHIPVILLTARQTEANKIEGYNTGADEYIVKPFNTDLLKTRVKNLLESREKLRSLFSKSVNSAEIQDELPVIDQEFLKKASVIVTDNLADLSFDIDKLAEKLSMSRRQLYRKLSALTNKTVRDFITNIRLEKACALLLTGNYTISEVAYLVGFSEPANFSRSFSKEFGMSPKNFLSKKQNLNKVN